MMKTMAVRGFLIALAFVAGTSTASAQVFGTFPWQMQPYCNRVTLTLTSVTGNFTLDGSDDQCGAATKASANGIGVFNPDGSVGLNFTIVTSPGGKPVHVSAIVSPANGQGTWTDSVGNSGTFAFFGAVPGLPVRPLPASGLPAAVITNTEIAPGAVTGASVANGSLTIADLADGPRAAFASGEQFVDFGTAATVVRTLTFNVPAAGVVLVNASGSLRFSGTAATQEVVQCSVTTGTTIDTGHQIISNDGNSTNSINDYHAFGATRGFNVSAGTFSVNLVCAEVQGDSQIVDSSLTALFVAQ